METHHDRIFLGMALAALSIALLAVQSLCAKLLAQVGFHPIEIAFWRSIIALIPLAIWIAASGKIKILTSIKKPWILTARVVNGIIGLAVTFAAIKYLPLADATVLFFANVIIAPIMSVIFLKEKVGLHRWGAIIVGMTGVIVAASPSWQISALGLGLGLLAATMQATTCTLLRALKQESSLALTFYFFLGGSALSALALPFVWHAPSLQDIPLLLAIGASGGAAQVFLAFAFRFAPTSAVMPFQYTGLMWAIALDFVIWSIYPTYPMLLGGLIVIASHMYIVYRERLKYRNNK